MTAAQVRKFLARGKPPLLLAALLLLVAFGLEFHHHDDGKTHSDCSVCVSRLHARSADLSAQPAGIPVFESTLLAVTAEAVTPSFHHRFPPVIRPPPA
ncbi:MAG TPA: hypothetical protein DD658_11435 [Deltaproteobacteria bacterium]|nr:MAG: hypothetical protein A2X88_01110 [Deltaproteobacteria bacterium GWC2_65_14]HBO70680.1 hypothetical protein [Deltaproteobacteria bacterium]